MFVLDEAHFVFPAACYRNSPPMRLNWLRTKVVDRGDGKNPVALVSTPQDYAHAASKFVKASGYNLAQWSGRIVHQVNLPAELEFEDLLAIAKLKCPDLDPDLQELIARRAGRSENYIAAVESISRRAHYIAQRDGHPAISLSDVNVATAEVIPGSATAPAPAQAAASRPAPAVPAIVAPIRQPRRAAAGAPRPRSVRLAAPAADPAPALAMPRREVTPALVAA
jgi:hypothetical protein